MHNIVSNFANLPVSNDIQSNIRRMHCLQLPQKPCGSYRYVYRSEDGFGVHRNWLPGVIVDCVLREFIINKCVCCSEHNGGCVT